MKKLFSIAVLFAISTALYAQKDVTKFLGIPVDGYKAEMIQKLKAKGYTSSASDKDILEGEFNGTKVDLYVVTNNNKVYRIMVADQNSVNETDIKIRFNKLCKQFQNNKKYMSLSDYTIPDDEDISYEMLVNKKRYEAVFYQIPEIPDTLAIREVINSSLSSKYTKEQLSNPTEEQKEEIKKVLADYMLVLCHKKSVWFMISEHYGKYYINMYYDNEYNRANGEDL